MRRHKSWKDKYQLVKRGGGSGGGGGGGSTPAPQATTSPAPQALMNRINEGTTAKYDARKFSPDIDKAWDVYSKANSLADLKTLNSQVKSNNGLPGLKVTTKHLAEMSVYRRDELDGGKQSKTRAIAAKQALKTRQQNSKKNTSKKSSNKKKK
ncbi:hypothetical protein COO91_01945 [Nostoc flagelliforme CCNUN1]|uniref:Uncharacterized protein n=1 Tax=Nostoc flagelliforme CCNUN1 TaxID=2038116 RepID=A0A2K8SKM6_9NOSO|nr:hypothetical protein [Nostoc flagelliforme]AUB36046.1 hypothetical protein COO91_01945 [Nostoc flagelliforme CCNUN1]